MVVPSNEKQLTIGTFGENGGGDKLNFRSSELRHLWRLQIRKSWACLQHQL